MIRSIRGSRNVGTGNIEVDNSEMEVFCGCIDRMFSKVNEVFFFCIINIINSK